ncbi:C-X-C chemokine receptor type 3 [Bombina bombina]|uniref:C-X-C chemokine receptor type 3 n=1 Tax=Bombina bombina TaxID=8345 RepID=UPI00235A59C5|nr:C-X-C chemokine receptor type 3 [Bombina bombina]
MVDSSDDHKIFYFSDYEPLENSSLEFGYSDSSAHLSCNQQQAKTFDGRFLPAFYSPLFILGMLGNVLVVVVLLKNRQRLQSTEIFIMHLAVADILLVMTLPFWAVQAVSGWLFGEVLCKMMASVFKINFYAGIFLLMCISIDRYMSIVYAVQIYKKHRSHMVHWSCLLVWGLCIILSIPDIMFSQVLHEYRTNVTECQLNFPISSSQHWRITMILLYNVLGFLLPLCGMLYCYTHIILTLVRSQGFKKHRALRVIIAVVVAFFLCWAPYNIAVLINALIMLQIFVSSCAQEKNLDIAMSVTLGLCYFHCCLNPVLYAFVGAKFKNKFVELLSHTGICPKFVNLPARPSTTWSESADTSHSGI